MFRTRVPRRASVDLPALSLLALAVLSAWAAPAPGQSSDATVEVRTAQDASLIDADVLAEGFTCPDLIEE